jgi:hypothetical protein
MNTQERKKGTKRIQGLPIGDDLGHCIFRTFVLLPLKFIHIYFVHGDGALLVLNFPCDWAISDWLISALNTEHYRRCCGFFGRFPLHLLIKITFSYNLKPFFRRLCVCVLPATTKDHVTLWRGIFQ